MSTRMELLDTRAMLGPDVFNDLGPGYASMLQTWLHLHGNISDFYSASAPHHYVRTQPSSGYVASQGKIGVSVYHDELETFEQ